MSTPLVSVVIPAYNAEESIKTTLESVLAQTFNDFEVIVVDDGSSDKTAEVVETFKAPKVQLVKQNNQGPAAARNTGVEHSQGEFIAFLDADDVWYPEKLEKTLKLFQKEPQIGLVYHKFIEVNALSGERNPGQLFTFSGTEPAKSYLPGFHGIHTSTVVIRRKVLEKIGLFDVELRRGEDVDLWLRVMEEFPIRGIPEVLSEYRKIPTSARPEICEIARESSFKALDKAFERKSDLYQKPKICAMNYLNIGKQEYFLYRFKESRDWFNRSLREKWTGEAWWYYLKSFLPVELIRRLRSLKESS